MTTTFTPSSGTALTEADLDSLRAFAVTHGRTWKSRLKDLWQSGRDEGDLRRLRNRVGPAGLAGIRLPLASPVI